MPGYGFRTFDQRGRRRLKHNPLLRDHYIRLLGRGKAKQVALVACV